MGIITYVTSANASAGLTEYNVDEVKLLTQERDTQMDADETRDEAEKKRQEAADLDKDAQAKDEMLHDAEKLEGQAKEKRDEAEGKSSSGLF